MSFWPSGLTVFGGYRPRNTAVIKKIPKRLSSRDNSTPSRITKPEEDHPA